MGKDKVGGAWSKERAGPVDRWSKRKEGSLAVGAKAATDCVWRDRARPKCRQSIRAEQWGKLILFTGKEVEQSPASGTPLIFQNSPLNRL